MRIWKTGLKRWVKMFCVRFLSKSKTIREIVVPDGKTLLDVVAIFEDMTLLYKVYDGGKYMSPDDLGYSHCNYWVEEHGKF